MSVEDSKPPYLSIILPAYNEESRLPESLDSIGEYLRTVSYSSELIVVDDGSDDRTVEQALSMRPGATRYRVLSQPHKGKAAAVRTGVLAAKGEHILFTDADLSTPIAAVQLLLTEIDRGADIAIGSREGQAARRINEPAYRHVMGRAFNRVVQLLAVPGIDDTQCGFKLFTAHAARQIFPYLRLHQGSDRLIGPKVSAFDVEILFISRQRGLVIAEVPVNWTHVQGSKVRPIVDALRMLLDVFAVRLNAVAGKYNFR